MISDKPIPFKPGYPVDPKNFEGRQNLIDEHVGYLNQVVLGVPQHFFINGKRGMGKSSFARYLKNLAEKYYDMLCIHIYNDGVHDVETLIKLIVENLLNEVNGKKFGKRFFDSFKDHIDSIGLFGSSIKFKENSTSIFDNIRSNFAGFLMELTEDMGDKKGIFIIIDDINGLSNTPDFANWYKSFTDTLATSFDGSKPIAMMLSAHPDKINALYNHNPSFNRIFIHREIGPLKKYEVSDFFINAFKEIGMSIDEEALDLMIHFSSGHPTMMQEIGAGIYWTCENQNITKADALKGIIRAGEEIGVKYLKSSLDSSIRSNKYISIFNKLGEDFIENFNGEYSFKKKDFAAILNENEGKVFGDFLIRARQLGILEFSGAKKSGNYKFTNNLFPLYFAIRSLEEQNAI